MEERIKSRKVKCRGYCFVIYILKRFQIGGVSNYDEFHAPCVNDMSRKVGRASFNCGQLDLGITSNGRYCLYDMLAISKERSIPYSINVTALFILGSD